MTCQNFDWDSCISTGQGGKNWHFDNMFFYLWMWNNLSIYLVLPKYLSSKPCSLPHVNLAHILLEVCLGIFLSSSVNGSVLLISNFTCSLLIYRKVIDFCILISYLVILIKLLVSFKIFLLLLYHLKTKPVLFLPSPSVELSSLFLSYYIS